MTIVLNGTTRPPPASARRVVVVLSHLGPGGAERVVSSMTAYWVERGYDVTVVTLSDTTADFYRLDRRVKRMRLPRQQGLLMRSRRFLVRQIERDELPSNRGPAGVGERRGTESRRLDGLRATYRAVRRLGVAILAFVARNRLLGGSSRVYTLLLRACSSRVRTLRGIFTQVEPDVVFSLIGSANVITVAASVNLPHRTVISERNDPRLQRLKAPWEDLRPILYSVADTVSANSRGALASMRPYCPEQKLRYIPNPLILADPSIDSPRSNTVLFLARLAPQKMPDVLVEAFARLIRTAPDWKLQIAGDGPMAEELQTRVRVLGLTNDVTFPGVVENPTPLLRSCRIFVLPSRFEGTPNVLLEAMACRTPCIVSDASPGPLCLIEHGATGLVVETGSVKGLADAMAKLSGDERMQRELGDAGFERVREFGLDRVGPIWDRILFPDDCPGIDVKP